MFATALSGVDLDNAATVRGRASSTVAVPRIVGPIRRLHPRRTGAPVAGAADPAPDCGMKYTPRDLAFAKLKALADGAAIVCRELSER